LVGFALVPAFSAELSPAQIVAQRFPAGWLAGAAGSQSNNKPVVSTRGVTPADSTRGIAPVVATRALPTQMPAAVDLYFNPNPTFAQPAAQPATLAYAEPTPAPAASQPSNYQLASASAAPERRADPQRAAAARSNNVFNDTQIASIKERLNLRPGQERMWPQVEEALRGLVYKKLTTGEKKSAALTRTLDPASPEVARLKTVAVPLVMSFDSEQKRELRTLAHLIGLGNVVAQF
jgi:hypothetical protein